MLTTELRQYKILRKLSIILIEGVKPIVYTMASSGIRVGAWDYLKWGHIVPIKRNDHLVAAKVNVYAGKPDEYFTFITPEAYHSLESWIKFREISGESITGESWLMRPTHYDYVLKRGEQIFA